MKRLEGENKFRKGKRTSMSSASVRRWGDTLHLQLAKNTFFFWAASKEQGHK